MITIAAILCAALAGAVLAGRPSPLRTRLGRRFGDDDIGLAPRLADRATYRRLQEIRTRIGARRRSDERENDIAEICLAMSAELRSGVPMASALAAVADDWPELLGDVAGQVAIGGDTAAALRRCARPAGAAALNAVAAAWDVAERTGAPLSRVLLAVADSLRMAAAARREAQSQLATARTTARLMAALPFGTLLLLSGGDGSAVRFLLTTPVGLVCLAVAGVLVGLGLWWVGRVSRTAVRTPWTV